MDTGRAGTIGGTNLDDCLGKSFFAHHGILPVGAGAYKKEGLHSWPARDFEVPSATGTITADKSLLTYSDTGPDTGCWGWNFGADKTKALFIIANVDLVRHRVALLLNDGEPNTKGAHGAKGVFFRMEKFNHTYDLGTTPSATGMDGASVLQTIHASYATLALPKHAVSMAIHYDTAGGGMIQTFLRYKQHEWIQVMGQVTANIAAIRCASIYAYPEGLEHRLGCPMGIYAV